MDIAPESLPPPNEPGPASSPDLSGAPSFILRLTRFVILRLAQLCLFDSLSAAANPNSCPLLGEHGLTGLLYLFMDRAARPIPAQVGGVPENRLPSSVLGGTTRRRLCWPPPPGPARRFGCVVLLGDRTQPRASSVVWALSIVHHGRAGLVRLRLGNPTARNRVPRHLPLPAPRWPSVPETRAAAVGLWLFRWLIFRIMLGAGLIKMRGDPCWRDLTALYYHFETQPIPNPLSRFFHFLPHWICRRASCSITSPNWLRRGLPFIRASPGTSAGVIMVTFQVMLILSGNLSFLNWLTIVPVLACFDDSFWARLLPMCYVERRASATGANPSRAQKAAVAAAVMVALLSVQPVVN